MNRIEYICQGNPDGVADLLLEAGYDDPHSMEELIEMAKEWVRLDGKYAIKQLLHVHPERDAILHATMPEDGFCGCEHAYSGCGCGGHDSFTGELSELQIKDELAKLSYQELKSRLDQLRELAGQHPEDQSLLDELDQTSQALEQQKDKKGSKSKNKKGKDVLYSLTKKDLAFGGTVIALAFLVSRI